MGTRRMFVNKKSARRTFNGRAEKTSAVNLRAPFRGGGRM